MIQFWDVAPLLENLPPADTGTRFSSKKSLKSKQTEESTPQLLQ